MKRGKKKESCNVWILNHYAVPPALGSGTRHFDIARYLAKRGYKVRIFVANYQHLLDTSWKERFGSREEIIEDGVIFQIVETRPCRENGVERFLNMWDYYRNVLKIGTSMEERPHVIWASSVHPLAWCAGIKLSKKYSIPLIIEVRDIWPETLIRSGKMSKYNPVAMYFSLLERKAYKKADHIIALMPSFLDHLRDKGMYRLQSKTTIIPNFVDLGRYERIEKCDLPFDTSSNKRKLVYLGAHGPFNDLKTVIKGFEMLVKVHKVPLELHLFGSGPEKNNLVEFTKRNGITGVYFHSTISKNCVPYLLKLVDAAVFPLVPSDLKEAGVSSNKLVDYMASKIPIISVDLPGLPVKHTNGAFFYKPGDPRDFCGAVLRFLKAAPEELHRKAEANFEYVKEYRSLDGAGAKVLKILNELVKGRVDG